ncbi:MAG: NifB/NifX family molybdenum-iron cluster-binding protein [Candidatus Aminicenantales bacterium]
MKAAISTENGYVSSHFGRCPSYTIVEIREGKINSREEIPNPGHQPGFLPRYLAERGVNCIIAGGMGPRAQDLFAQNNIETIIGVQGQVDDVIGKFLKNELEAGEDLCDHGQGGEQRLSHPHCEEESPILAGQKLCFSATGKDLEAEIDPRFGRARYFIIVDPKTLEFEALENPAAEESQGAGIQTAQLISSKNVGTIITGDCGPNALRALQASGIKVITGARGNVRDVLLKYRLD